MWKFENDTDLPFLEIQNRNWCIGFGHVDIGWPKVQQWLCLHHDYLSNVGLRLLTRDGIQSYVFYISSVPRLR